MPGPDRRPTAAALHGGRRSDRPAAREGGHGGSRRRRREAPDRRDGDDRSPPPRRKDGDRGREKRRRKSPTPAGGRATPHPTGSVALVENSGVAAESVNSATSEDKSDKSPSPSRGREHKASPEKVLDPKGRKKLRRRKGPDDGGPAAGGKPPLVIPTGHFDYIPLQEDDSRINWSSWLLKWGMQDGVMPLDSVIVVMVEAGFWSPSMVAATSLSDFAVTLRRMESAVASNANFEFLVERIWRLSQSNGPNPAASGG